MCASYQVGTADGMRDSCRLRKNSASTHQYCRQSGNKEGASDCRFSYRNLLVDVHSTNVHQYEEVLQNSSTPSTSVNTRKTVAKCRLWRHMVSRLLESYLGQAYGFRPAQAKPYKRLRDDMTHRRIEIGDRETRQFQPGLVDHVIVLGCGPERS
jgi:hypothetical protein